MLQINNLDGKSDWMNEGQLIIPMVDNEEMSVKEIEGISKHGITLNGLEGSDQTLLTNGSGQTFVIGLDQTLFENYNSKSDLLLMPNSDLKLLPAVSDTKLTYSLTPVDNSKNEIVWGNNAFEKPLTKDILNVIHDTSKGWQEIEKNGEICLDDINSVEVHDSKLNADFLIEPHMVESKKLRSDSGDEYIVGYYPVVEACDTVLVPASLMTIQSKTVDNEPTEKSIVIGKNVMSESKNMSQLFENESIEGSQTRKWMKSEECTGIDDNFVVDKIDSEGRAQALKMNNTQDNSLLLMQENITNLNETVIPLVNSADGDFDDAKPKNEIIVNDIRKCATKDKNFNAKVLENKNNILPEQSLPLKKKAKMKKSAMSGTFNFSSGDTGRVGQDLSELHSGRGGDVGQNASIGPENNKSSDSEESKRKRKNDGTPYGFNKKAKEEKGEEKGKWSYNKNEMKKEEQGQNGIRYKNITQLLEQLKSEKYINEGIFRILHQGLLEMDVDVLEEMYRKQDEKTPNYSSHLKAFALMLHFKQPTAFNRLGELFLSGWPPLSVIKEWKRRLNNHRKPNKIK